MIILIIVTGFLKAWENGIGSLCVCVAEKIAVVLVVVVMMELPPFIRCTLLCSLFRKLKKACDYVHCIVYFHTMILIIIISF